MSETNPIYKLDKTDKAILELIQVNSRLTIKEIADKLHLSTTPIFDRLKKLEKHGVISSYVALVNGKKLGKQLTVFVNISISKHGKDALNGFVKAITKFPEVMECHHISGDADFLLKLILTDIDAYNTFILDKLSVIPNIGKVESRFSLSERKNTTAIPIK